MRILLESTDKIVTLVVNGHDVPARVWQGETVEGNIPIHCYVTSVAVKQGRPKEDYEQFETQLKEQHGAMRPDIAAIPLRLIL